MKDHETAIFKVNFLRTKLTIFSFVVKTTKNIVYAGYYFWVFLLCSKLQDFFENFIQNSNFSVKSVNTF